MGRLSSPIINKDEEEMKLYCSEERQVSKGFKEDGVTVVKVFEFVHGKATEIPDEFAKALLNTYPKLYSAEPFGEVSKEEPTVDDSLYTQEQLEAFTDEQIDELYELFAGQKPNHNAKKETKIKKILEIQANS